MSIAEKLTIIAENMQTIKDMGGGEDTRFEELVSGTLSGDITTRSDNIKTNGFSHCPNITSVTAPNALAVGNTAFMGDTSLQRLSLPVVRSIGTQACYQCNTLVEIYAPFVTNLSTSTFQGCGFEKVELPSLRVANSSAFASCASLVVAKFDSLTTISTSAFSGCSSLVALVIGTENCSLSNINALANTPIESGTGYIYVPDSAVDTYKSKTNWNTYASQIKGISQLPTEISDLLEGTQ